MMPSHDQVRVVSEASIYGQLAPSQSLSHVARSLLLGFFTTSSTFEKNLVFSNAVRFPVLTFGLLLYCYGWSVCDLNKVSHGWPSSYLVHKCLRRCCVFVHVAFITRVIHLVLFPQLQFKIWATFINATLPCCLIFLYWVDFVFINLKFTASTITPASIILMLFFY